MLNYYVSAARGSDETGTGTADNPWKTIGKAIGASPGVVMGPDGSRLYIEPGRYYETVWVTALAISQTAPLEIIGDVDGAGFLAGGRTNPMTGIVEWIGWQDDESSPGSACISVNGVGRSFVTLRRIKFHASRNSGGGGALHLVQVMGWRVFDCTFVGHILNSPASINVHSSSVSGTMLTVERCDFLVGIGGIHVTASDGAAVDEPALIVRNSRFIGGRHDARAVRVVQQGSAGGVIRNAVIEHCTFIGGQRSLELNSNGTTPPTSPYQVRGCLFLNSRDGIWGHSLGSVVEDDNVFHCTTPLTNVVAGPHSSTTLRPAVDVEDGRLLGLPLRPLGEPLPHSSLAGFVSNPSFPANDLAGRSRPEGYRSVRATVGALERHDTGEPNSLQADQGSSVCLALRGPSSLERPILVDAVPTTIRVKVRWDGRHGDMRKPQAVLVANPEIGVPNQVLTAVSAGGVGSNPNAYETLTFSPIRATRSGVVMLRLVSRSSTDEGTAYFDTVTIHTS